MWKRRLSNYADGAQVIIIVPKDNPEIKNSRKCFRRLVYPPGGGLPGRFLQVEIRSCGRVSSALRKSSLTMQKTVETVAAPFFASGSVGLLNLIQKYSV